MEEKGLCDYMKNVKYKFIRDLHESFIQINDIKFDSLWHPALTDNKNSILNCYSDMQIVLKDFTVSFNKTLFYCYFPEQRYIFLEDKEFLSSSEMTVMLPDMSFSWFKNEKRGFENQMEPYQSMLTPCLPDQALVTTSHPDQDQALVTGATNDQDYLSLAMCDKCGEHFEEKEKLRYHIKYKHTNKQFQCNLCSKTFNHNWLLKRHILSHSASSFKCKECSASFKEERNLKSHIKKKHSLNIVKTIDHKYAIYHVKFDNLNDSDRNMLRTMREK